jgi:hypothetical protein
MAEPGTINDDEVIELPDKESEEEHTPEKDSRAELAVMHSTMKSGQ